MNRRGNVPFNPSGAAAAGRFIHQQTGRPPVYRLSNFRTPDMTGMNQSTQKHAAQQSASKWKSSFKDLGDEESQDLNSQDKSPTTSERTVLYDPYDPIPSDSEFEMLRQGANHPHNPYDPHLSDSESEMSRRGLKHNHPPLHQDASLARQRLSQSRGCREKSRWDLPASELEGRPEHLAYSSETVLADRPGYGSVSRPLDHRGRSPDRLVHSSSSKQFPATYRGQRTNGEERITAPEYSREQSPMTITVRLSPPRSKQGYQHQSGRVETGLDQTTPSKEVTKHRSKSIIMDGAITCDLCDVEFANGQELEDHLDSKSHWGTLEHIQQQNNYDDLAIAFLQEVMLYKSRQFSRAIEDSALQALQENDHMTKVEMFHCASCQVFISTSASSVQSHITSQEHISYAKEFEVQQRRACLDKAETMMTELKPQFEHFIKGGCPFV